MIIIADSGSTKTHWCLVGDSENKQEFFTKGINPFYQSESEILKEISTELTPYTKDIKIDEIHFYGAGCAFPQQKSILSKALQTNFEGTLISIDSDLTGAARALFGRKRGVACILGTGSNSCLYDGKEIIENISPLGFILGDEGSGAVLGKQLVADCLKNQLPEDLKNKFLQRFELSPQIILNKVYKEPFPNRFLASLSVFLKENIENEAIYNIVYSNFRSFFTRNVMQYSLQNEKVGFVGSIAFYYKDVLEKVAADLGIILGSVDQNPMKGLIDYHVEQ